MEYKIKPCPTCTHSASIIRGLEDGKPFWYVRCDRCGLQSKHYHEDCPTEANWVDVEHAKHNAISKAVSSWNVRPIYDMLIKDKSLDEVIALLKSKGIML